MEGDRLVSIGQFSLSARLTVRALRLYDRIGLLAPARVDPETGYRYYALPQAAAVRSGLTSSRAWSKQSIESSGDAKVRAEAEVRRGGESEAIQDSWPEETISVNAVAVEPYKDLE